MRRGYLVVLAALAGSQALLVSTASGLTPAQIPADLQQLLQAEHQLRAPTFVQRVREDQEVRGRPVLVGSYVESGQATPPGLQAAGPGTDEPRMVVGPLGRLRVPHGTRVGAFGWWLSLDPTAHVGPLPVPLGPAVAYVTETVTAGAAIRSRSPRPSTTSDPQASTEHRCGNSSRPPEPPARRPGRTGTSPPTASRSSRRRRPAPEQPLPSPRSPRTSRSPSHRRERPSTTYALAEPSGIESIPLCQDHRKAFPPYRCALRAGPSVPRRRGEAGSCRSTHVPRSPGSRTATSAPAGGRGSCVAAV